MLRKERKQSHMKYSGKTTKGRKRVEDKNRNKEQDNKQKMVMNMVDINTILILNVSGLNVPIKRQIVRVDLKT